MQYSNIYYSNSTHCTARVSRCDRPMRLQIFPRFHSLSQDTYIVRCNSENFASVTTSLCGGALSL
jgi:hypothetical protein